MASLREQVAVAALALVAGALPNARVTRNAAKPQRPDPGGNVIVRDGDPGDPDVVMSPLTYTYRHEFELDVMAYESATQSRETILDDMFQAIGLAVENDRTLGGLADWMEAEAPAPEDIEAEGVEPVRFAKLFLVI